MKPIAEIQINYLRLTKPIQEWHKPLDILSIEKDQHLDGTKVYIFFDDSAIFINPSYEAWYCNNYR